MSNKFIAELHDVGKLVDKNSLSDEMRNLLSNHTFINFDFRKIGISKPTSASWWGQYHHKIKVSKDINNWEEINKDYRPDLFLLIIADHLASSISRALPGLENAGEAEGVLKLWNYKFYANEIKNGKKWAAFRSDEDIKQIFDIIDTIKSPEEFLNRYREYLLLTPEDKSKPRDITSLFTHVELVGKIYRVLKKHCKIEEDQNGIYLTLNGEKVRTIKQAEGGNRTIGNQNVEKGQWQARFVKCYIKFPHSFVRLQDLNLLVKRQELLEKFIATNKDYVMFHTHDVLSLFLPLDKDLKGMFSELLESGFLIETVETIADLGILSSNLDNKLLKARKENETSRLGVFNSRKTKVYRNVLSFNINVEQIKPPICDICQMQPAKERTKENIKEWLCDKCYKIRESGESFNYPEEWMSSKIVWFKFSLNHMKLENWLQEAFDRYIDSLDIKDKQICKDEFRSMACYSDFVNDYFKMVKNFWEECKDLEIKMPILNYKEIGVCKYSGIILKEILKRFMKIYCDYFPDCEGNNKSPVSLSLSISPIKYPLREHFRYFENQKGFINIKVVNIFEDIYTKDEIKCLLDNFTKRKESSHFLCKLIELYDELQSEIYIIAEIFNNRNIHPLIYELYSQFKISPKKILNFFRIIEDTYEGNEINKALS